MSLFANTDKTWGPFLDEARQAMDPAYWRYLETATDTLPAQANIFNAFSLPRNQVRFILIGESPYPRPQSATGFAFMDGAVNALWSAQGLSKPVNRATSLRNFMKMLLIADGALTPQDTSQAAIAALDKSRYIDSIDALQGNFHRAGVMLLNATLTWSGKATVRRDAAAWRPFINALLARLAKEKGHGIQLILLGKIAKEIEALEGAATFDRFVAEHPYNVSFVSNPAVVEFFKPMGLLR